MRANFLCALFASLCVGVAESAEGDAKTIGVTWEFKIDEAPKSANVGDQVVFSWSNNHNVQAMLSNDCSEFIGDVLSEEEKYTYTVREADAGKSLFFACAKSSGNHCKAGMKVEIDVAAMPAVAPATENCCLLVDKVKVAGAMMDQPCIGTGACLLIEDDDTFTCDIDPRTFTSAEECALNTGIWCEGHTCEVSKCVGLKKSRCSKKKGCSWSNKQCQEEEEDPPCEKIATKKRSKCKKCQDTLAIVFLPEKCGKICAKEKTCKKECNKRNRVAKKADARAKRKCEMYNFAA